MLEFSNCNFKNQFFPLFVCFNPKEDHVYGMRNYAPIHFIIRKFSWNSKGIKFGNLTFEHWVNQKYPFKEFQYYESK